MDYLAIDCLEIKKNLNNAMDIYNFLDSIVEICNLKAVNKPYIIPYYYGKVKNDEGISCLQLLEDGYMTFHVFEHRRIAYFDLRTKVKVDKQIILDQLTKFAKSKKFYICGDNKSDTNLADKQVFGPHNFIKLKINEFKVDDMIKLLNEIVKGIGMTPITSTFVESNYVIRLIAESHIAITKEKNHILIDIFSCKEYDNNKLLKTLKKKYEIIEKQEYKRYAS